MTSNRIRGTHGPAKRPIRRRALAAWIAAVVAGVVLILPLSGLRNSARADVDPLIEVLSGLSISQQMMPSAKGTIRSIHDLDGFLGAPDDQADITDAGVVELPTLPPWLLKFQFVCGGPGVVCPSTGSEDADFDDGGYLFYERLVAPQTFTAGIRYEFGPVLSLDQYPPSALQAGNPFGGASHAIITRVEGTTRDILYFAYQNGTFQQFRTRSRSLFMDDAILTLVPKGTDIKTAITGWDPYAYWSKGTPATTGRDNLRGFNGEALLDPGTIAQVTFVDIPEPTQTPTAVPSTAPPSVAPSATPAASAGGGSASTGGGDLPWLVLLIVGLALAAIGVFLLRTRSRAPSGSPGGGRAEAPGGTMTELGGPAMAIAGVGGDPCPPLIAAAKAAREACDEAQGDASAADEAARSRQAEADAARADLERARRAREAAEKELARRQKPPDRGGDSASTTYGGRAVTEDSYDLHLLEDARAAANDRWEAAKSTATSDAERKAADDAWQEELQRLDGPAGIDEIRRRDREGRAKWVKEAEEALKSAREAEATAQAALDRATASATAAADAAAAEHHRADEACAKAEAAEKAAADAGCLTPRGGAVPVGPPPGGGPRPPQPDPPMPPDRPVPPPVPPSPPTPPGPPPTPPTRERSRACPEGSEPMVRRLNPIDVDLYLVSESHLKIDSNYPYGDNIDEALDDLDSTLGGIGIILTGAGAITDPIPALLGKAGVPGFDDITTKPAEAAANALRRLRERMEKYRKTGVWSLSVPRQHYQFFCQVTEECRDGQWVETRREFIGQRIGPPTWDTSPSYEVQNVDYDSRRAWVEMTAKYARLNAAAERQIADAMSGCAG